MTMDVCGGVGRRWVLSATGQHLLMSGAGRLFHRVIMQSNPFSYHYRSLTIANFLGQVGASLLRAGC